MSSYNSMVIPHESVRVLIGTGRNLHVVPPDAFTSVWWPHGPVRAKGQLDFATYTVTTTEKTTILAAKPLGRKGIDFARQVRPFVDGHCNNLGSIFGVDLPGKLVIIFAPLSETLDGSGGAYHYRGKPLNIYVDVTIYPQVDKYRSLALFISQAVEAYESVQNQGWRPERSNGEALSRVIAEFSYPYALDGFETASTWLDSNRTNWIDVTNDSDACDESNGCGVLFIYWLYKVLKMGIQKICQAGAPTLAETYYKLTGKDSGYLDFMTAVEERWPQGSPSNVYYDNPW